MLARSNRRFFRGLESLRGVAACAVVLHHCWWSSHLKGTLLQANTWIFVDFFFVLSGFIITHTYRDKIRGGQDFQRFVALRLARLYPLHFLLLHVFVAHELVRFLGTRRAPLHNDAWAYATHLLLAQSMNLNRGLTFNVPSWSISVEFYTYLAFAGCAFALQGRKRCWPLFGLVSLASLICLWRVGSLSSHYDWGILRCLYGFFLGALSHQWWLARSENREFGPKATALEVFALGAVAAGLALGTKGAVSAFGAPPLFAFAIIVFAREEGSLSRLLSVRGAVYLGKISYSIYMSHFAIVTAVLAGLRWAGRPFEGRFALVDPVFGDCLILLTLATTLIASHLLYLYFEDPLRRKLRAIVDR